MKKTLLLILFAILNLGTFAQWVETFNYTVGTTAGGNCITTVNTDNPTCSNNNWTTSAGSTANANTINVVAGSLSYSGFPSSVGNKIEIVGDNTNYPRDIHRTISFTPATNMVVYASFLLNVEDVTNLTSNAIGDNGTFFHMSNGASPGGGGLFCRVSINKVNAGANYRIGIVNNTGGAPAYTVLNQDLVFGTTYLIVVKYDFADAANDIATLWLNPSSFGGAEPTGSITNSLGTTTYTTITQVGIRNSSFTPKAFIDEIRVGQTWADVTSNNLPINLKSFSGKRNSIGNLLSWSTATETNNTGFEIQASSNGTEFSKIEFVKSKAINGNGNQPLDYNFTHYTSASKQYYRLNQIDLDGKFSYSPTILINTDKSIKNVILLSENPLKNDIILSVSSNDNDVVSLQLFDVNGRIIKQQKNSILPGSNNITLLSSQLSNGVYFVKVQNSKWQEVIKVIK